MTLGEVLALELRYQRRERDRNRRDLGKSNAPSPGLTRAVARHLERERQRDILGDLA